MNVTPLSLASITSYRYIVNSVCLIKENVLLVGTHIDKLHPDIGEAHKISCSKILPVLKKELCGKPYAHHLAGISKGIGAALKRSCLDMKR